jgi:catechol 2,3-dioxygenase-like lactoylglutathione lyase family enzyme
MLINKVTLYSQNLDEMKDFYVNQLGFNLLDSNENSFEIIVGDSVLEIKKYHLEEKPFYHFAINIPSNLFKEAKEWAKTRATLIKEEGEDEVYFSFLNADSFYFLDPSANIVEFISRYSVSPKCEENTFSAQKALNISEINITTNDVISVGNQLIDFGIPERDGDSIEGEGLNFMGENEDGAYLLLGPRKRRWFFSDKESEIFPLTIQIDNYKNIVLDEKGKITFLMEEINSL